MVQTAAPRTRDPAGTRRRLVDATLRRMLRQGFAATTVDEICAEAALTKGSFFHHFESKESISQAALEAWGEFGMDLYAAAWRDPKADPLDQLHKLFDIMCGFARRPGDPCVCMVGMMSQELAATNPGMRKACAARLMEWTEMVRRLLAEARKRHRPVVAFDPENVAWMLNSLWQGSMLVAKARQRQDMIVSNLLLARAFIDSLFGFPKVPRKIKSQSPSSRGS